MMRTASASSKGFTLVEILAAIIIALVVIGISYPIWVSAKEKSGESVTANSLHQTWLALELYRQDQDQNGLLAGTSSQLGLPNQDQFFATYDKLGIQRWSTGRVAEIHYYPRDVSDIVKAHPGDGQKLVDQWVAYTLREQGGSVLFGDFSHTQGCPNLMDFRCLFSGYGVDLSGALRRKEASGNDFLCVWWEQ